MARVTLPLHEIDYLPEEILTLAPADVRKVFPEPTLIRLDGKAGQPLFVSCLLHGNETTGFLVLQRLTRWFRKHPLPRPLMIFVGNVHATEAGRRRLDQQPDFNRIWNGGDTAEHELADRVFSAVTAAKPFAAIDIHNNTGINPLYGCVNSLNEAFLHLGSLFSPTLVYFENPPSVISIALSRICPSITVEAGKPADPMGVERAFNLVLDALHLHALRTTGLERPMTVFKTIGRMEIDPDAMFSFSPTSDAALVFPADMDHWNFSTRQATTHWARLNTSGQSPLRVFDENRSDITDQFFQTRGQSLHLTRDVTPSMITLDAKIIRSDCLGYLMEPVG